MLEIKGLKVDLEDEDKQILKGVDLSIEPGKVHAIMGPNGSGKTTFLKCINPLKLITNYYTLWCCFLGVYTVWHFQIF